MRRPPTGRRTGRLPTRATALHRRNVPGLALILALLLGACDSGVQGPGVLMARAVVETATATASGADLGAVVLEIRGSGIQGFAGRGGTRLYSAPLSDRPGTHRVILVDAEGGEIGFDIMVDDVGMDDPTITVVEAADTDNATMSRSGVTVRIER